MYRRLTALFILSLIGSSCTLSPKIQADSESSIPAVPIETKAFQKWHPATYRGMRLGSATVDDLIKVLGKPSAIADLTSVGNDKDLRYVFDKVEYPAAGQLSAWVDKRRDVIHTIEFGPDSLKRKDLNGIFGPHHQITRYAPDLCAKAPFDASAVYESTDGNIAYIEYREKGLAIAMDESHAAQTDSGEDRVAFILFLSEPIGSAESRCN